LNESPDLLLLHPPVFPWCTPTDAGLDVVLLTDPGLPAGHVFVRSLSDNEELLTPMVADGVQGGRLGALHRWRAHVAWDGGNALTRYAFVVARSENEGGALWLAADGTHALTPPEALHFCVHPTEQPPAWVRAQVFYQIFPDRFARSRQARPDTRLRPWGAVIDNNHRQDTFYGGDLAGVLERRPYLQEELGVSALYLTPIFESRSNHRYDTRDYFSVDPLLGGEVAFGALRQATQALGLRLVLDAVVNHTGPDHAWLQSRPHFYARNANGEALGWKGHASLPVLDFAQRDVQDAVYAAPDAVLRHWLRGPLAIDGWRLDVIHMLGEGAGAYNNAHHVRHMRRAIRQEKPDAYVLGEHFSEATRWLQGEQEDGAMNYHGFATPVWAWLAGRDVGPHRARISTAQFEARLSSAIAPVPYANQLAQLNLLGSHDTQRMLTRLRGDVALMQVAMTLLFTRPGVPCIYYGDETGLQGGTDPDCRRCFDWDRAHWQQDLWAHCQRLARARHARSEWQDGATLTLAQGADWLVYARFNADAATVVAVNRGDAVDVVVPLRHVPVRADGWTALGETRPQPPAAQLRVGLPARSSVCLLSS
jgi:alpha-glucosidase